jgi:endonuclease YncB( thermonuclease family)
VRFRRFSRRPAAPRRRRSRFFDYALTLVILGLLTLVVVRVQAIETVNKVGIAKIIDGDSLELNGERIRLEGIDAPEFDQSCLRDGQKQPCGQEARRRLRELTGLSRLSCKGWQRDKYDRLLGVCEASGKQINREMVRSGWAVAYGAYGAEEGEARRAKLGLWGGEFVRPQEFRRMKGDMLESPHDVWRVLAQYLHHISGIDWR